MGAALSAVLDDDVQVSLIAGWVGFAVGSFASTLEGVAV